MKRKLSQVTTRRTKKPRGILRTYFCGDILVFPELINEIKANLIPPWKYTFDLAMTFSSGEERNFKWHTVDIVKHGLEITKWFLEKKLIITKYIARFACYYGLRDVFEWSQSLEKTPKMESGYLEMAAGGGQIAFLEYLAGLNLKINWRNVAYSAIFAGKVEVLDYIYQTQAPNQRGVNNDISTAFLMGQLEVYRYLETKSPQTPEQVREGIISLVSADQGRNRFNIIGKESAPEECRDLCDIPVVLERRRQFLKYLQDSGHTFDGEMYDRINLMMVPVLYEFGPRFTQEQVTSWVWRALNSYRSRKDPGDTADTWIVVLGTPLTVELEQRIFLRVLERGFLRVLSVFRTREIWHNPYPPLHTSYCSPSALKYCADNGYVDLQSLLNGYIGPYELRCDYDFVTKILVEHPHLKAPLNYIREILAGDTDAKYLQPVLSQIPPHYILVAVYKANVPALLELAKREWVIDDNTRRLAAYSLLAARLDPSHFDTPGDIASLEQLKTSSETLNKMIKTCVMFYTGELQPNTQILERPEPGTNAVRIWNMCGEKSYNYRTVYIRR